MSKISFQEDSQSLGSYYKELDFTRKKSSSSIHDERNGLLIRNFSFHAKLTSEVLTGLNIERSKSFMSNKKNEPILDVWKIKPPDFSLIQFDPKPIGIREKAKQKQEKVKEESSKEPQKQVPKSAPILNLHAKEYFDEFQKTIQAPVTNMLEFQRTFRPPQPQEDRMLSLKNSKTTEPYTNPKKHDFRQYVPLSVLGLPEFKAVKELDNTIFQRELLKLKLPGTSYRIKSYEFRDVDHGAQLGDKRKTPSVKFNPDLKLPKGTYPEKHQEHTRHRRLHRTVRSAFLEKVENELTTKWKNDMKERMQYLELLKKQEIEKNSRENKRRNQTSDNFF